MSEEFEEENEEEIRAEKIGISLPSDLVEKIKEYAKDNRLKRSQVVKKALAQFFEESEEPDLWEDTVSERLDRIEGMQKEVLKKIGVEEPKGTAVKPIETGKIQELIEDCITEEGKGFEIDGEDGFLALCEERELIGDVWTEDNLKIIASYLKKGYDNYLPITQPEREELIEACVEAMELNDKQKEILSEEFGKLFEGEAEEQEEEEEEEW